MGKEICHRSTASRKAAHANFAIRITMFHSTRTNKERNGDSGFARITALDHSANGYFDAAQEASESPLLALPPEMILKIMGHLAMPWQISFALTCKRFTEALFGKKPLPRLSKGDRTEFLSILAKDVPNVFFCFCCAKLRPLDLEADWDGQSHRSTVQPVANSVWTNGSYRNDNLYLSPPYFLFADTSAIYFMNAYLAMRRHFYGASHGISLQSLQTSATYEEKLKLSTCHCSHMYGSSPSCNSKSGVFKPTLVKSPRKKDVWRFSSKSTPKIVDGSLYIGRSFTIVGPLVRWEQIARLIESVRPGICQHLECSVSLPRYCRHVRKGSKPRVDRRLYITSLMGAWEDAWEGLKSENFDPETGSCLLCATDYDVSLKQDRSKKEWHFTLHTYHCLGSCQTPNDQLWVYFTSNFQDTHGYWGFPSENIPELEELKSRHLKLDGGGARRIWYRKR
ncbi:hypothetical protein GGI42DRAFT_338072 [Trichoderma sp. SZMC 28013]